MKLDSAELTQFLPRKKEKSEFSEIREKLIEKIQTLSGHAWTDFNLHDPGVTIVEQLAYALTDINYRSDYPVNDILTNKNDQLPLHRHGMFTTDEALPCNAYTIMDMQKLLLDRIHCLTFVYLTPSRVDSTDNNNPVNSGFYDIYVKYRVSNFDESGDKGFQNGEAFESELKQKIREEFYQLRNLGEDLNQVNLIKNQAAELVARIEVNESRAAVDILSDIYYCVSQIVSGSIVRQRYASLLEKGISQDDLYTGPWLEHGYVDDSELIRHHSGISISGIVSSLKKIDGILKVRNIAFKTESGQFYDFLPSSRTESYQFLVPADDNIKVILEIEGKPVTIDIAEFVNSYELLTHNNYHQQYFNCQKENKDLAQPHSLLTEYHSIQSQFPDIYGINYRGLPESCSVERKSQSLQLKGYLTLFDQIMSDQLANLDNIKTLFSLETSSFNAYKTLTLSKDIIPDINKLYSKPPDTNFLADIEVSQNYFRKKSRVFNFMLAMNGRGKEVYGFEYKNPYFTEQEVSKQLLKNKYNNLKNIHQNLSSRSKAFDYSNGSWGNYNNSTMEKYILNVLGVNCRRRSLVYPMTKQGLRYQAINQEDKTTEEKRVSLSLKKGNAGKRLEQFDELDYLPPDLWTIKQQSSRFSMIPDLPSVKPGEDKLLISLFYKLEKSDNTLMTGILKFGSNLEFYRVGKLEGKDCYDLFYNMEHDASSNKNIHYLFSCSSIKKAYTAANQLRKEILNLTLQMEGMHIIEHQLLLPVDKYGFSTTQNDSDFYHSQLSVIFPSWTLRFEDPGFQDYVERLVQRETPAHLYPHIFWLNFEQMESLEILFKNWLRKKRMMEDYESLNEISGKLKSILISFNERQV